MGLFYKNANLIHEGTTLMTVKTKAKYLWKISLPFFFLRFYLFIFGERGREGEREGGKCQCVVAFHVPPSRDLAHNPGVCHDWELNW